MSVISIRLNTEVLAPLGNLAQKLDRSRNCLINQAIKEFIQRQSIEDSRWVDTLEALNSVKAGNVIGEKEVTSWLNSWGTDDELPTPKL